MTDGTDPRTHPRAASELASRAGPRQPPTPAAAQQPAGPTGHAPSTESAGDPDRVSVDSGAQAGAGAGAVAGTAVAGPIGAVVGAAAGAAGGTIAEAADTDAPTNDDGPLQVSGSEGTGPVDPATDYVRR